MPGEFHLSGTVDQLTMGSPTAEQLAALAGVQFLLTSNLPLGTQLPTTGGIYYVGPRIVTVLPSGQISEDNTNNGIMLLADDPALDLDAPIQWTIKPLTRPALGVRVSVKLKSWTFTAPAPGASRTLDQLVSVPNIDAVPVGTIGIDQITGPTDYALNFLANANDAPSARTLLGVDLLDLDEYEEYANFAALPGTGTGNVIYLTRDDNELWRWSGSTYVPAVATTTSAKITDATPSGRANLAKDGVLNILGYGVATGTSTSQTAAIKTALDANPGRAFYFPPGDYRLDTQLDIANNNSLILAPGARIYAGAALDKLINYDNGQTATDSLAADRGIVGYGKLDGNLLANKVLRVASVLRFSIEGLTFVDGVNRGLVVDFYAAEVSADNLRFANTTTTNVSDNVAIEVNGNDSTFSHIRMRDWTIGVWDKGANTWIDIHPWIGTTAQLTARYQNSVAFKLAGDSVLIAPYADTYRYSFQSAQTSPAYAVARLVAPRVYCAPGNLTNTLAAAYPGVVFYFTDAGGFFTVTQGSFKGHPTTNHAFTSGPADKLFIKNSLPASYITGFGGYEWLTAAQWASTNLVLGVNEWGVESDTGWYKIGDGTTAWNSLPYAGLNESRIHAATSKSTPVDADELALLDSAGSFGLKKLTWANLKAAIAAYYNTLVATVTNKDLTSGTNTFPTFNQNTTGSAAKLTTARAIDGQSFDGTADITVIAPGTHAATSKSTPVDADELSLVDSAASNVLKKLTWANLKAAIATYYNSLTATLTNKTLTQPQVDTLVTTSGSWLVRLLHVGSFNLWYLSNSATGNDLTMGVDSISGDTNRGLNFTTKGTGTAKVNGTDIATKLSATASLDFGSVSAQSFADLTITVTGAATGDSVALGVPTAAVTAGIVYSAWVSSSNTVTVRAHNYTAGALDPASGTFKASIIR